MLNPEVWGPPFWFVLHTLAITYPQQPTEMAKKKYYDLITNLPLFLPSDEAGELFGHMLDQYPVSSYLDNRDSFIKWIHFIHNKYNEKYEKPTLSLNDFYIHYYEAYKPKEIKMKDQYRWRERLVYFVIVFACLAGILWSLG